MSNHTPKKIPTTPQYRRHKASGRAVVTLQGKDHYLGPFGSKSSRVEYDRLLGEWLANGRTLPPAETGDLLTIAKLILRYWSFAKSYYLKDGQPTGQLTVIKAALRLRDSFMASAVWLSAGTHGSNCRTVWSSTPSINAGIATTTARATTDRWPKPGTSTTPWRRH